MSDMFDLEALAIKDSVEVQLRHPVTDEPLFADKEQTLPIKVTLWSTSSKAYRSAINAMQNRNLKRGKKTASAEDLRKEGVELLTACSQRIDNLAFNGAPIDNEESFRGLYSDDRFTWLKGQVDEALGDVSNFIKA